MMKNDPISIKGQVIKNAAEVDNVKEMTLVCRADKNFWEDYLEPYGLTPSDFNGRAKIYISTTELTFKLIKFNEVVISIFVKNLFDRAENESVFLLHAFNSNRFFSWAEREFFSTPYSHGQISFDSKNFTRSEVLIKKSPRICIGNSIKTSEGLRTPKYCGDEQWRGVVHLPTGLIKKNQKWFYVKIDGLCKKYDFSYEEDFLILNKKIDNKIIRSLEASNISGYEWIVRKNAKHNKSKTYLFQ